MKRKMKNGYLYGILAILFALAFTACDNLTLGVSEGGGGSPSPSNPILTGTVNITGTAQSEQVTVAMWDSYGDGWNGGAALRINVNGTNLSSNATLSSDNSGYYTFDVNAGDIVTFYWVTGTYDDECAFAVYYSNNQPNPPFNPNSNSWSPANDPQGRVLLYKQYSSSETEGNGTLMGSFTVPGGIGIFVDQTLTVNTSNLNGSGTISYQWKRDETAIPGANSSTYTVKPADVGSSITVTVTRYGYSGSVTSPAVGPVAAEPGTGIIIDLADMNEWELAEQTAQATPNVNKIFAVTGTYMAYRWYLDGESVGTASSYTFNKPDGVYQLVIVATDSSGESRSGHCWVTVGIPTIPSTRNITVLMWDSYGDGWNSASLRITVNGVDLSTNPTISSGGSNIYTFDVNTGDSIAVYWNKGSYDEECAFAIYYTNDSPSPAFNPSSGSTNNTARLLVHRLYSSLSSTVTGTLLGSFTVNGN